MSGRKGSRRRPPSKGSYHKKQLRQNRQCDAMPAASDVMIFDAEGNVVGIEPSRKPIDGATK